MLSLSGKIRKNFGKKVKFVRKKGLLPAILYGPKIKDAIALEVDYKEFEKVYKEAGESSLIKLEVKNFDKEKKESEIKEFLVLIHDFQENPLTGKIIHVDFYQPSLEEETTAMVPIILEGEAPVVKEMGGTLVKNISEVEIKALPQKLLKEIKVNVENLKTFEDHILIKNLLLPEGVKILRDPEEIVVSVLPPEKVEEELEKPIEEKVEEVEKVEEKEEEGN